MRISSLNFAALLCAAMMLGACGGGQELQQAAQDNGNAAGYENWQPQQSMEQVIPLDDALRSAAWVEAGGFSLTALDSFNRTDAGLLESIELERNGNELVVSSSRPVGSALLYLRSDAGDEHAAGVEFGDAGAIGISVNMPGGTQAIGISGRNTALLATDRPLATLSIASGAAVPERSTMAIDTPNNKVGLVAQQQLIAQDNGEAIATLSWRERLTGDYDINGVVTIADITPLGINLGKSYDKEDPDASPKVEIVDGDFNGLITLADITPIGQNFNTQITGYDVYRTALSSASEDPTADVKDPRWSKVENKADPGLPSAPRSEVPSTGVRLTYTFVDDTVPDTGGEYAWAVVPLAGQGQTPHEGPVSNIAKVGVSPKGAPVDLVIQDPATGSLTVGDEFWVAVRITDVIGLFSANMRLEYDGSILEVVEVDSADQILPEYTDGAFSGVNLLSDPLFIGIDNVAPADSPYVLLGFNDTQKKGTPVVDGSGNVGYIKFRAIAEGSNTEAIRWPQSSTFILMWGEEFGVPAVNPILGPPLDINIGPAS
ncbi:MAG: hypothetical protein H7A35_09530 [Planctomycetales bacterium]|nr:hypothetical protein [bacterium]UNM07118.1 MAG: hypothetical protein H7A35_09530 [Planctomycetales bacterium]